MPSPAVAHRDHDVVARLELDGHARDSSRPAPIPGFERQLAAIRHRVTRIQCEVGKSPSRAGWDRSGPARIVRQHQFDFDLFAEVRSQQPRGIDDQGVDVRVARL